MFGKGRFRVNEMARVRDAESLTDISKVTLASQISI